MLFLSRHKKENYSQKDSLASRSVARLPSPFPKGPVIVSIPAAQTDELQHKVAVSFPGLTPWY